MDLERYRGIIPEWSEFQAACTRPEPKFLRTRTGRIEPDELRQRLEDQGFELRSVPSLPHMFRIGDAPRRISDTRAHWSGLLYVQQASTAVAAPALGPEPGQRILDMCAAPGGKTTHLADLANDRATVVASDPDDKRLRGLLGNLYRMSHPSVMVVSADGRRFPDSALFDRVLVDAPCSAEGNVRRHGGELRDQSRSFLEHVTGLQEALLRRAVRVARPGGSILYATCTFNPDENEAVVSRVLADEPVSVEPVHDAPSGGEPVPHEPGLTEWRGRSFHGDMEAAWRIYPHHLDSGGLFLCRLRKDGGGTGTLPRDEEGWTRVPAAFPGDENLSAERATERVAGVMATLDEDFGVRRATLERTGWMARGDSVWGHTLREWPAEAWSEAADWRFIALGIRAARDDRRFGLRVTNDGLRWLGPRLERRIVDLDPEEMTRLLAGEQLDLHSLVREGGQGDGKPGGEPPVEDGNIALRLDGDVAGRGVARDGGLRHEIPKSRARRLRTILEREASDATRPDAARADDQDGSTDAR